MHNLMLILLQDQGQPQTTASEAILQSHLALRNRNHLQHFLQTFRIAATLVADSIALQLRALLMTSSRCSFCTATLADLNSFHGISH